MCFRLCCKLFLGRELFLQLLEFCVLLSIKLLFFAATYLFTNIKYFILNLFAPFMFFYA